MTVLVQLVWRDIPSVRRRSTAQKNWGKSERLDISLPFSFYHILQFVGVSFSLCCNEHDRATFTPKARESSELSSKF